MANKTFGELKQYDLIFFYSSDDYRGPGEIQSYCIMDEPEESLFSEDVILIDVQLNDITSKFPVKGKIEFCKDLEFENIDLEDYGINYKKYGSEEFIFATDINIISKIRKEEIESLIKLHEETIERLKKL